MNIKILIAEDEEITLKHLRYALEKEGYNLTCVNNGIDASPSLKKKDLTSLCRYKNAGMDGLTLLGKVKESIRTQNDNSYGFGSIESAVNAMKQARQIMSQSRSTR